MDQETAEVVKGKIAVMSGVNKKANEELVEALHRNDLLAQENYALKLHIEQLQAQIDSIYTSGDILIKEVP